MYFLAAWMELNMGWINYQERGGRTRNRRCLGGLMVQEGQLMEFQHIIHNLVGGIILVHFRMMIVVCLFYFDQ
jgi:hypothetical protein